METKPFSWLNEISLSFLRNKDGYIRKDEDPIERIREIADVAEKYLKIEGFSNKFFDYMGKGYYSLSSPVWANFGKERGCPISCFSSFIEDNLESIMGTASEVGMMSKLGGGTSAYFGAVRGRGEPISSGGYSDGSVEFMRIFDTVVDVTKQAAVRRGAMAAYLPIDHKDIEEFLRIKTEGHPIQNLFTGVCVSDEWMKSMIDGDIAKRKVWARVIQSRTETGLPYVFFSDNVNKDSPKVYKDKSLTINNSNLCSEVTLHTSPKESFVCCLSSMNLLHYEEWKNTDAVETLTKFLDAVLEEFIIKTENNSLMERARRFSINQRAIGVGVFGWHSLLQSKMIAFESMEAKFLNVEIFKVLNQKTLVASKEMAISHGEPPLLKGYGERFTTRIAIAPTTSSATIIGQASQSIEPYFSNYYEKELAKIRHTVKNPYLEKLLESKGKNTKAVWNQILRAGGSVQELDFLTEQEKDVFRTFEEISQKEIVIQAIQRQKYIDQSQSLNLMIDPATPAKEINQLMIFAWENGIKTLYYQHSSNAAQKFKRELNSCQSCES